MKYKLINGCAETVLQETSLGKLTETLESFSHKTHAAKSRLLKQTYLVSKQQLYTEHAVHWTTVCMNMIVKSVTEEQLSCGCKI